MAKQIFVKQQTKKKQDRHCLHCGADISHRSKGVLFCCPACKAYYKDKQKIDAAAPPELPKIQYSKEFFEDAASVYYTNPMK